MTAACTTLISAMQDEAEGQLVQEEPQAMQHILQAVCCTPGRPKPQVVLAGATLGPGIESSALQMVRLPFLVHPILKLHGLIHAVLKYRIMVLSAALGHSIQPPAPQMVRTSSLVHLGPMLVWEHVTHAG